MDRKEIMNSLQEIVRETVDNEELILHDDTVASDVEGWDSLAQVIIVGEIQNTFGVKFSSLEMSRFDNVGQLVDAIMTKS